MSHELEIQIMFFAVSIVSICVGFAWGVWYSNRCFFRERELTRALITDLNSIFPRGINGHHITQRSRPAVDHGQRVH